MLHIQLHEPLPELAFGAFAELAVVRLLLVPANDRETEVRRRAKAERLLAFGERLQAVRLLGRLAVGFLGDRRQASDAALPDDLALVVAPVLQAEELSGAHPGDFALEGLHACADGPALQALEEVPIVKAAAARLPWLRAVPVVPMPQLQLRHTAGGFTWLRPGARTRRQRDAVRLPLARRPLEAEPRGGLAELENFRWDEARVDVHVVEALDVVREGGALQLFPEPVEGAHVTEGPLPRDDVFVLREGQRLRLELLHPRAHSTGLVPHDGLGGHRVLQLRLRVPWVAPHVRDVGPFGHLDPAPAKPNAE
mmetsp:Transcript_96125/g.277608  ORF Transcript_96125/g.277608 Transcript_96125/m.277608 type:complete len:310 (-) Transcript_96125:709-1638(-)